MVGQTRTLHYAGLSIAPELHAASRRRLFHALANHQRRLHSVDNRPNAVDLCALFRVDKFPCYRVPSIIIIFLIVSLSKT